MHSNSHFHISCMHPPRPLSTDPNLVHALNQRHPGHPHVHSPHIGPVTQMWYMHYLEASRTPPYVQPSCRPARPNVRLLCSYLLTHTTTHQTVQSCACVRHPGRLPALHFSSLITHDKISIHAHAPNLYLNVSCMHPPILLFTSLNLVSALPQRRSGCFHLHWPHSHPVSLLYVTVLSYFHVNATGSLACTEPCMCEVSWTPHHTLHPRFYNNQSNIHPRVHQIHS